MTRKNTSSPVKWCSKRLQVESFGVIDFSGLVYDSWVLEYESEVHYNFLRLI